MKNINPLFLTISCIMILFIAIFSQDSAKNNLELQKKEFEEFKLLAVKYKTQKQSWSDKKVITNTIQKILKSSGIKNANIIQKDKLIIVQMVSLNITQIQKFINNLLNEKINIKKLDLTNNKIILNIGLL